jgi:enoyl-CoA hydratase/carnithine racemase
VKVVVFESAVDGFFLNHSDFLAKFEDLTSIPQGPTGLEAWPDVLVRLTRAPFVSIALIRGRATGNGSELALACDMSFASREKALLSQWEVGVGLVAGGGPMARLPRAMGRGRALEVLLSADDIRGADAELLGYVNRALPDAELDNFVDALATRIASFDKWAIANTKRLVNEASLPPDVEIRAGWDACMASVKRPAALVTTSGFPLVPVRLYKVAAHIDDADEADRLVRGGRGCFGEQSRIAMLSGAGPRGSQFASHLPVGRQGGVLDSSALAAARRIVPAPPTNARRHGATPSISVSSEKLRNVLITTISPST